MLTGFLTGLYASRGASLTVTLMAIAVVAIIFFAMVAYLYKK